MTPQRSQAGQFVRGGQNTQHWYRMAMQVFRYACLVMLVTFTLVLGFWCFKKFDPTEFTMSRYWMLARINMYRQMPDFPLAATLPDGRKFDLTSRQIYESKAFHDAYYDLERDAIVGAILATQVAVVSGVLVILIFFAAGRKLGRDEHLRGARLVPVKDLKAFTSSKWDELKSRDRETWKQPRYTMAGLEFPPDALQAQTGIFGTTGSGKTTLIKELITSIRASGGHAIIYDRDGDYAASFYEEDRDIIINPFDARSHCWSPFHDADTAESFTQLYNVLIPTRPGEKDPFWSKSARIVAEFVSRELVQTGRATNAHLRDALMNLPMDKLEKLVSETPADKFVGEGAGKMGSSVYATMLADLRFLEFLRDDGTPFSTRKWVRDNLFGAQSSQIEDIDPETGVVIDAPKSSEPKDKNAKPGSFLFLTGHPELDAATRNITSAIMELAATTLMGGPQSRAPKLFFIIDELATLNRLPFLTGKLAEVRKVGGCFVVGFQVLSQLEDIYGREGANTVMGNLNNTIYGSTPDHTTAEKFSKALGMVDQLESRENISVGAETTRDGVSFMQNRVERAIATPTEIMRLPQFKVYLTFAYDSPTALVKFKRSNLKHISQGLVPYTGAGFGTGSLNPDLFVERATFLESPIHKRAAEFSAWLKTYEERNLGDGSRQLSQSDKEALWAYYAEQRLAGIKPELIGPPAMESQFSASIEDAAATNPRTPHAYRSHVETSRDADSQRQAGPRIIVCGSTNWTNETRLWDYLDQTFYKYPDMVLGHKGMIGAEEIASAWATARKVPQMVFSPNWDLHGEAAPDRADADLMRGTPQNPVRGIIACDGRSEIANLVDLAKAAKINIKHLQSHKPVLDIPDYPLSNSVSREEMCATPAAFQGVDTAPLAAWPRRATAEGAISRKRPKHARPQRKRTAGTARDRTSGVELTAGLRVRDEHGFRGRSAPKHACETTDDPTRKARALLL